MKVLHTYKPVDVYGTQKMRWVVYELSDVRERANGQEFVVPREVWSTRAVDYNNGEEISRTRRQAFEECCKRNAARPRRTEFSESIAIKAQLNDLDRRGIFP
jgi:hypothetical protein